MPQRPKEEDGGEHMELMTFKNKTWEAMRGILGSMETAFRPIAEDYGLTSMEVGLLIEVCQCGSCSVGEAAKSMGLAAANGSALCKRMERKGYLVRSRKKEDERVVEIFLTQRAREVLGRMEETMEERYGRIFRAEPEENIRTILQGIQLMDALLKKIYQEGEE